MLLNEHCPHPQPARSGVSHFSLTNDEVFVVQGFSVERARPLRAAPVCSAKSAPPPKFGEQDAKVRKEVMDVIATARNKSSTPAAAVKQEVLFWLSFCLVQLLPCAITHPNVGHCFLLTHGVKLAWLQA